MKGSSAYQLARKIKLLKKGSKVWKKSFCDNKYHDIDRIKKYLAIQRNYVMNNPFAISIWQQVNQLKSQLKSTILIRKFIGHRERDNLGPNSEIRTINIFKLWLLSKNSKLLFENLRMHRATGLMSKWYLTTYYE